MPEMHIDKLPVELLRRLDRLERRCLIVDGYTGAGKTTMITNLTKALEALGVTYKRFNIDWYIIDRDKRNYKENPKLMDLTGWFDLDRAEQDLLAMLQKNVSFVAYDRATGKRSSHLTLEALTEDDVLIIEGLYGFLAAERLEIPALRIFFSMTDDALRDRIYKRNTYIPRERLEYEVENIYLPSMKNYVKNLKEKNIGYDEIDVSDFTKIRIL